MDDDMLGFIAVGGIILIFLGVALFVGGVATFGFMVVLDFFFPGMRDDLFLKWFLASVCTIIIFGGFGLSITK